MPEGNSPENEFVSQLRKPGKKIINNSGRGQGIPVLRIVSDKFNWGAFFLTWIWGLGNNTYIALLAILLAFIPFIGSMASLAFAIWLGVKGNTFAWQNKRWKGIKHFHEVQKVWAIVGTCFFFISIPVIIGVVAALTIPSLMNNTTAQEHKTAYTKAISSLNQSIVLEYALNGNTPEKMDIAEIMKKRGNVISECATWPGSGALDTTVKTSDGMIYTFMRTANKNLCEGEKKSYKSDGYCRNNIIGKVDVNGENGPNKIVDNVDKPQDQFVFTILETTVLPGSVEKGGENSLEAKIMYNRMEY